MQIEALSYLKLTAVTGKLEDTGAKILEIDYTNETSIMNVAQEYGTGVLNCLVNCGGKS